MLNQCSIGSNISFRLSLLRSFFLLFLFAIFPTASPGLDRFSQLLEQSRLLRLPPFDDNRARCRAGRVHTDIVVLVVRIQRVGGVASFFAWFCTVRTSSGFLDRFERA